MISGPPRVRVLSFRKKGSKREREREQHGWEEGLNGKIGKDEPPVSPLSPPKPRFVYVCVESPQTQPDIFEIYIYI